MVLIKTLRFFGVVCLFIALVGMASNMNAILGDNRIMTFKIVFWTIVWLGLLFNFCANVWDTIRVLYDEIKP